MTRKKLIDSWYKTKDDVHKWSMLYEYAQKHQDYLVNIDNDDIFVSFDGDEETTLGFGYFGYDAIEIILKVFGMKASLV